MNKQYQFCTILLSCLIFITCCSKDDDYKSPVSVYVTGKIFDKNVGGYVAAYWKNGKPVYLTDGRSDGWAKSVYVMNMDVYIAGATITVGEWKAATYWKNGVPVYLTDDKQFSTAYSIFVK